VDWISWDSQAVAPDTTPTADLDRYLAETKPEDRQAEASRTGDAAAWAKYLSGMPDGVSVRPTDGVITRRDLFALAEVDRAERSDRSALDLFWNTMAWGIAGTWRNVPNLSAYFPPTPNRSPRPSAERSNCRTAARCRRLTGP